MSLGKGYIELQKYDENMDEQIEIINKFYELIPDNKLIDYTYITNIEDNEIYGLILFIKRILNDKQSYFEYENGNYKKILDSVENCRNILDNMVKNNPNAIIIGPGDSPAKTIKILEGIYNMDNRYDKTNLRFLTLPLSGRSIRGDIRTINYIRTFLEYNNIEISDENIKNIYIIDYVHNGDSKYYIINFFKEIYGYEPNFLALNNIIDYSSRSLLYGDALGIDFPRCSSVFKKNELAEFKSENLRNPLFYVDESGIKYCNIILLFIFLCINKDNYFRILYNSDKLYKEYTFYTFSEIYKYYYEYLLDIVVISQEYPYTLVELTNVYLDKSVISDEEIMLYSPNNDLSYKYTLYNRYSSSNILYISPIIQLPNNSFISKFHKYYGKICRLTLNNTYIYGIFNDISYNYQSSLYKFTEFYPNYHIDTYFLLTNLIDEIIPYNFLYQNVDKQYFKNIDDLVRKNLKNNNVDYVLTFFDLFSDSIVDLHVEILSINSLYYEVVYDTNIMLIFKDLVYNIQQVI